MQNNQDEEVFKNIRDRVSFSISMRERLIEDERERIKTLVSFGINLMGIYGIIAGFGFSAFQFINFHFLFFVGEILTIGSIFYLGIKIKTLLVNELDRISEEVSGLELDTANVKAAIVEKDGDKVLKLAEEFNESISNTKPNPIIKKFKPLDDIITVAFWVGALGILTILISFFVIYPKQDAFIQESQSISIQIENLQSRDLEIVV
jgi:hypothetical protein